MSAEKPLTGYKLVAFESRLSDTVRQLVEKYGGELLAAPAMQEVPLEKNEAVLQFGERLRAGEVDMLICMTGVGTRMLIELLERQIGQEEVMQALRSLPIVARGPKPVSVLNGYKIPVAVTVPEPNTWREVLTALTEAGRTSLDGCTVAIQEYGEPNEALIRALEEQGATVVRVPVYRWELPTDTGPLNEAIEAIVAGRIQGALFTSRNQVTHVVSFAEQLGLAERVREAFQGIVVGSVGPVCSEALRWHGLPVDFEPSRPKLTPLIKTATEAIPRQFPKQ